MKYSILFIIAIFCFAKAQAQQPFYPVTAGDGNGIRFWNSDSYKIHMGNSSVYHYGPVTNYSIKMNINSSLGRGWTWGIVGQTPIAALNNTGTMQIAGNFYALGNVGIGTSSPTKKLEVNGDFKSYRIYGQQLLLSPPKWGKIGMLDGTSSYKWFVERISDLDNSSMNMYFRNASNVTSFSVAGESGNLYTAGNVGIGTTSPEAKLEILDTHEDLTLLKLQNNKWICNQRTSIEFWNGGLKNYPTSRIVSKMDGCGTGGEALLFETQTAGEIQPSTKLLIKNNGNVGIGTTTPDEKLAVNGNIHAKEVRVDLVGWPDYVFTPNYNLPTLEEVKQHIDEKGHLPNMPTATEVAENGINLGEMNAKLLRKIEELTLYIIQQKEDKDKKITSLEEKINQQQILIQEIIKNISK